MTPIVSPRRAAAVAAVLAVVGWSGAGCGGEPPAPTDGATGETTGTGQEPGPVEPDVVASISTTLGGGSVDEQAVDLGTPGGVEELVGGLEGGMPARVRRAVRRAQGRPAVQAALDDGSRLYGAVVWIGCEQPEDLGVVPRDGGLDVSVKVPDKGAVQCLAPVTTVLVFTA